MSTLIIVAKVTAKENKVDLAKQELTKLLTPTRQEAGCIKYILNQDNKDPSVFIFYEEWESYDSWQDHMKTPHILNMRQALEGALEGTEIFEMTECH